MTIVSMVNTHTITKWVYSIKKQINNHLKSVSIMNQNHPTIVAHPTTGEVITMFTGKDEKEYGRIRVDQTQSVISNNMERIVRRTAFITLPEDVIKAKGDTIQADAEYKVAGKRGKLIVIESTEPFFEAQEPKTRGAEGSVITSGGQPVYRDTLFTLDLDAQDTLLPSDSEGTPVEKEVKEKETVE